MKELIEKRAYHLFLKRGGLHGYHMQDWFLAEKEISAELEAKKKAPAGKETLRPAAPQAPGAAGSAKVKQVVQKAVRKSR